MFDIPTLRREWLSNPRRDILAGIVVALALIPEAIGFSNDLGSIKEGKLADLILLTKNPLDDIRNTNSIKYVMKNGILYNADSLDEVWPTIKKLPPQYWHGKTPKYHDNY